MYKLLNCFYQNARGLRTKTKTFYNNHVTHDYDVIFLSETWLLPGVFDAELFDCRYNVYRTDRDYARRGMTMGGGSLIAIKRELRVDSHCSAVLPHFPDADVTHVDILLSDGPGRKRLHLYCCYFPGTTDLKTSELLFFDAVSELHADRPNDEFLVVGDFNCSHAVWKPSLNGSFCISNPSVMDLVSQVHAFMCFTGWSQYNGIANHNNRILDLVFSSFPSCITRTEPLAEPEDVHHPSLFIVAKLGLKETCLQEPPYIVRRFHAADYNIIKTELDKIQWEKHLSTVDIECALDSFYAIVNDIIDKHVPTRIAKGSSAYPIWFSSALIKMLKQKNKMHRKWITYGRSADYENFSNLRRSIKKLQTSQYNSFLTRCETNINRCSKYFWSFIKSKRSCNGIPDSISLDDRTGDDGPSIAYLFNEFFQSVFENDSNLPHTVTSNTSDFAVIGKVLISHDIVEKYLNRINVSKGSGPDGLHPFFIKTCSKQLSHPVFLLFKTSLTTGIMPRAWKKSFVVPIHKSGDKHNARNYRGISKLSVLPKVFEKIVYDQITPIINPVLTTRQHGFVTRRSTETNLCEYLDFILDSMDNGSQVDVVYTDYSKAFDKISHSLLIAKLEAIGIHGDLLRWLSSYLRNRSQAVTVKGYVSTFIPVTSGVPQGSHLGPLLFNIFINDVTNCFQNSKLLLYADDTKIFSIINSIQDCELLQQDLNRLCHYCDINQLYLNVDKCCTITFSRKKRPIKFDYNLYNIGLKRVQEVRDLGLQLDSGLYFEPHISKVTAKAYKLLGFILRQSTDFKNPNTLILLYNAYVRSQLEYASVVWNPMYAKYIDKIESIQNKFIKKLKYRFKTFNTENIVSLNTRRECRDQIFLYKIIHNLVDSPYLLHKLIFKCCRLSARHKDTFLTTVCSTNYKKNAFLIRACDKYNKKYRHIDIFHEKIGSFRYLLQKQYN